MLPRAINPDGKLKGAVDWVLVPTLVMEGAGLGANSTIRCGVTIGRWALVGAGSVVTKDVPNYGLVYGNPARLHGFVCPYGQRLEKVGEELDMILAESKVYKQTIRIPKKLWEQQP
jgi:acyl-[acyl carrier protein]--UDP-N-acetylglucosamine O-acyltransferase